MYAHDVVTECSCFYPTKAVLVLFFPRASSWGVVCLAKSCLDYVSGTIMCRKVMFGRNIG